MIPDQGRFDMAQRGNAAALDARTPWAVWILIIGWVLSAGCAGSLKTHYANVGQIVRARTGQEVEWLVHPSTESSLEDLAAQALQRRGDLAAEREENATLRQILYLQQITRWVPILRVGLDYERNTNQTRVIGPTLVFDLPIFDWGQARVARTRALLERCRHRTEALETNIHSEIRETHERLQAARDTVLHGQMGDFSKGV
jgi:hypothetical protein